MSASALETIDVELLISLVQQFPCIYNKKDPNYKDNVVINNAWTEIGTTIDEHVESCQTVWKYLKEKYCRERKAYEKRTLSGAPAEDTSKWEYYVAMNFLDIHMQRRTTISNLKRKVEDTNSITDNESTEIVSQQTDYYETQHTEYEDFVQENASDDQNEQFSTY